MKFVWLIALMTSLSLTSCGEAPKDASTADLLPQQIALTEGRSLDCLKLGIATMKQWLSHREDDPNDPVASSQERMLLVVCQQVEPLSSPERVALATQLMNFMDQQTNLGYDLYQSGGEGVKIAARYAKLRGRLCQLMGNVPRAIAEYEACLNVLKFDDAEARQWQSELKEKK